jgi:hypothetical protein
LGTKGRRPLLEGHGWAFRAEQVNEEANFQAQSWSAAISNVKPSHTLATSVVEVTDMSAETDCDSNADVQVTVGAA